MGWLELAVGAVIGWFGHVAQVVWADRRAERQLEHDLSRGAATFQSDLRGVWGDIRNGGLIEERRISSLDQGVEAIGRILERVMVVRDEARRGRLSLWYLRARGVSEDVRVFNFSRTPGSQDPGTQRTLQAARARIEWVIQNGEEFEPDVDVYDRGPGQGLELRANPRRRP